jgi:hypothetical protein
MGSAESATRRCENQAAGRRKRRPRLRPCLLKGCGQRFHPRQATQRYCSRGCRQKARKWSRWKAQQKYRITAGGKEKRNGQSQRYRQRVKHRKAAEPEAISEGARVITPEHFFRAHVRPAGLLRAIRAAAAKPFAALLFARMPAGAGAGAATGAALEAGAHLIRTY